MAWVVSIPSTAAMDRGRGHSARALADSRRCSSASTARRRLVPACRVSSGSVPSAEGARYTLASAWLAVASAVVVPPWPTRARRASTNWSISTAMVMVTRYSRDGAHRLVFAMARYTADRSMGRQTVSDAAGR